MSIFRKPSTALDSLRWLSIAFAFFTATARAEVREVWAEVSNTRPYVGEAFMFTLRVAVTPGSDLANETILGLNNYPVTTIGVLRRAGRTPGASGNEVVSYTGMFRATAAFEGPVELILAGESVEQRRSGFFTQWTRSPFRAQARPLEFKALALPAQGRPENFSGAVGMFTLDVQSTPREVRVETLVTREIRLRGAADNLPGTLTPVFPAHDVNFTFYDLREISRAENPPEVLWRQMLKPLNTNAVEIVAPTFSFFDPKAGVYRVLQPPPEKLVFIANEENAPDAFKDIDTTPHRPADTPPRRFFDAPTSRHADASTLEITRHTKARLAPSHRAAVLFELEPGATVTIAERAEGWLRVVSRNRAGWINE